MHKIISAVMVAASLTVAAVSGVAEAKLRVGSAKGDYTFRVKGEIVDPDVATAAAHSGETVYRCKAKEAKAKKLYFRAGGEGSGQAELVECTEVDLEINPRTGNSSWKTAK